MHPSPSTDAVAGSAPSADQPVSSFVVPYGGASTAPPQNVLAWVSLGLAIGFVLVGVLSSIAAIVCGHLARAQIRRTGAQGGAAALTGLVLGYVFTTFALLGVVGIVLFFALFAPAAVSTGSW
jgi:hypothetical protein